VRRMCRRCTETAQANSRLLAHAGLRCEGAFGPRIRLPAPSPSIDIVRFVLAMHEWNTLSNLPFVLDTLPNTRWRPHDMRKMIVRLNKPETERSRTRESMESLATRLSAQRTEQHRAPCSLLVLPLSALQRCVTRHQNSEE
jgi:hypothetical protein